MSRGLYRLVEIHADFATYLRAPAPPFEHEGQFAGGFLVNDGIDVLAVGVVHDHEVPQRMTPIEKTFGNVLPNSVG